MTAVSVSCDGGMGEAFHEILNEQCVTKQKELMGDSRKYESREFYVSREADGGQHRVPGMESFPSSGNEKVHIPHLKKTGVLKSDADQNDALKVDRAQIVNHSPGKYHSQSTSTGKDATKTDLQILESLMAAFAAGEGACESNDGRDSMSGRTAIGGDVTPASNTADRGALLTAVRTVMHAIHAVKNTAPSLSDDKSFAVLRALIMGKETEDIAVDAAIEQVVSTQSPLVAPAVDASVSDSAVNHSDSRAQAAIGDLLIGLLKNYILSGGAVPVTETRSDAGVTPVTSRPPVERVISPQSPLVAPAVDASASDSAVNHSDSRAQAAISDLLIGLPGNYILSGGAVPVTETRSDAGVTPVTSRPPVERVISPQSPLVAPAVDASLPDSVANSADNQWTTASTHMWYGSGATAPVSKELPVELSRILEIFGRTLSSETVPAASQKAVSAILNRVANFLHTDRVPSWMPYAHISDLTLHGGAKDNSSFHPYFSVSSGKGEGVTVFTGGLDALRVDGEAAEEKTVFAGAAESGLPYFKGHRAGFGNNQTAMQFGGGAGQESVYAPAMGNIMKDGPFTEKRATNPDGKIFSGGDRGIIVQDDGKNMLQAVVGEALRRQGNNVAMPKDGSTRLRATGVYAAGSNESEQILTRYNNEQVSPLRSDPVSLSLSASWERKGVHGMSSDAPPGQQIETAESVPMKDAPGYSATISKEKGGAKHALWDMREKNQGESKAVLNDAPQSSHTSVSGEVDKEANKIDRGAQSLLRDVKRFRVIDRDVSERSAKENVSVTEKEVLRQQPEKEKQVFFSPSRGEETSGMKRVDVEIQERGPSQKEGVSANRPQPTVRHAHAVDAFPGAEMKASNDDRPVKTEMLVERVLAAVSNPAKGGVNRVKIALNPPNMGTMDMEVIVRDKMVRVVFRVEGTDVSRFLNANVEQLRNSLAGQGLTVDSIFVSGQGEHASGERYGSGQSGQFFQHEGNGRGNHTGEKYSGPMTAQKDDLPDAKESNPHLHGLVSLFV